MSEINHFLDILVLVREDIEKQNIAMREWVPTDFKLATTVCYMGTVKTYRESQYGSRIDESTYYSFTPKVFNVIYKRFKEKYLKECFIFPAWKVSKYGFVSVPYFSVFSPNTGNYGPEITPYLDTFHAVIYLVFCFF